MALVVPGGGCIEPIGKVGMTRITAFTKQNSVEIDGAVSGPDRATMTVLSGFPADVTVLHNGKSVKTVAGTLDGTAVVFAPLDGRPLGDPAMLIDELRVRRAAAAAAQGIDQAKTRINAWHLARAFPAEPAKALATVFPPEEGRIDLAASYPGGVDSKPVTWVKREAKSAFGPDIIELGGGDNRVAYAVTKINSDQEREVRFLVGSDDGLAVWVDRKEVWRKNAVRPCTPDEDEFPVQLKKGPNTVLVKITQAGSGWAFCLRVTDRFGYPLTDGISVEP